jgi:hypothetical protein
MQKSLLTDVITITLAIFAFSLMGTAQSKNRGIPSGNLLLTRWTKLVNPKAPLPEYPRPQMVRPKWINLNGVWEWDSTSSFSSPPAGMKLPGRILVPFPLESALSGVMRPAQKLWYRKTFDVPRNWKGKKVLLHFGAVDWEAHLFFNGTLIGSHQGGYDPFTFDVTPQLHTSGPQELIVGVSDPTDAGEQPRGKQVRKPGGIWYTSTTGIWQTVWLEAVPQSYIEHLDLTPDVDGSRLIVAAQCQEARPGDFLQVTVTLKGKKIVSSSGDAASPVVVPLHSPHLWSPSSPFLYDLAIALTRDGKTIDAVGSYFGMRKISLGRDEQGFQRIELNGKPLFQIGTLDQGFWPDGILTAPTDAALRYDIEAMRSLGFTLARKHVKVEPDRWYYWADRLGMLVWQDMPSGANRTPESKQQFKQELGRMVETHRNHPSIILWVVFNEGWGQHDTEQLVAEVKRRDQTRLVNNASGWTDKGVGDVMDLHNYPQPLAPPPESQRATVLGEFGGLGLALPGHLWQKEHWGYQGMADRKELTRRYCEFLRTVYRLHEEEGLSAAIYTQTTDVEVECNGILTYDREIIKPDPKAVRAVNTGDFSMLPSPGVTRAILKNSLEAPEGWHFTTSEPSADWASPPFNDAGWKTGWGGFGATTRPEGPVRTQWTGADIWLRKPFVWGGSPADSLCVTLQHDDDAEVYLNGVKAADAAGWTSTYVSIPVSEAARKALRNGQNLLAIHCHQKTGGQYIDAGLSIVLPPAPTGPDSIASVRPALVTRARTVLYTGNRAPLLSSALVKLPIGSITPEGWLRTMLMLERDGMTGHLAEISPWLDRTTSAWANSNGEGARGWEEMPYWLKGFGDLGYVLKDSAVIGEARFWIESVLTSQREDGWFGPRALLTSLSGGPDMWPHMVMLNVLQSYYEYSADARVLPFMTRYFQWQHRLPPSAFGAGYWPRMRMGDDIESVYWLYNRTGEPWLLDLAHKIFEGMARWDKDIINWHNVNVAQGFRAPAVYAVGARDAALVRAAERNYRKIMNTYGQFPGGGFAADENARPGFTDPRQGFETCGIVEFMHSFEMLTRISGDPVWSDRCEDLAYNSLPAAMTPDERGLHYLTCANQIQLDRKTKAPGVENGGTMFSYSPFEVYRCCQHNVSHGWPYFAEELWLATADKGLCLSLYAPSTVTAMVGEGTSVTIHEETGYPFDGNVALTMHIAHQIKFPLVLRVPGWCDDFTLKVNGREVRGDWRAGSFATISREWREGDRVDLRLGMNIRASLWEKNHNAISLSYGPLAFALQIGERWEKYGTNPQWPEWEVFPTTPWNYGLDLDPIDPVRSCSIQTVRTTITTSPFTPESVPLQMRVPARRIPGWQADYRGMVGALQSSPARTSSPVEMVTLIPMGAARLRISSFPTVRQDSSGVEWVPPRTPRKIDFQISASHLNTYDDREAAADGFEPTSSHDNGVARFTWWNHKGTPEWLEYDFAAPRTISRAEVYWFDEGEEGGCRVPQSWRLLYKRGGAWLPVETPSGYTTQPDVYNIVHFQKVVTNGLRLEVQLQPDRSAGVLEWKFED